MTWPDDTRDRGGAPDSWSSDRLSPPRSGDLVAVSRTGRVLSIVFGSAMTLLLLLTALIFLAQGRTGLAVFELLAGTATGAMVGVRVTTRLEADRPPAG